MVVLSHLGKNYTHFEKIENFLVDNSFDSFGESLETAF